MSRFDEYRKHVGHKIDMFCVDDQGNESKTGDAIIVYCIDCLKTLEEIIDEVPTVECVYCHKRVPEGTSIRDKNGWVGEECCEMWAKVNKKI